MTRCVAVFRCKEHIVRQIITRMTDRQSDTRPSTVAPKVLSAKIGLSSIENDHSRLIGDSYDVMRIIGWMAEAGWDDLISYAPE